MNYAALASYVPRYPPPHLFQILFFFGVRCSFFLWVFVSFLVVFLEGGASVSFVVWSFELLLSLVLGVERGRSSMLSAEMARDPWRDVS